MDRGKEEKGWIEGRRNYKLAYCTKLGSKSRRLQFSPNFVTC